MALRFPLYAKIVLWFFLNLIFLGAVFLIAFRVQFRLDLDSILFGGAGERIQVFSELVAFELNETPRSDWDAVLQRFGETYDLELFLFRNDGQQVAGNEVTLPPKVLNRMRDLPGPPVTPRGPAWQRAPGFTGPRQRLQALDRERPRRGRPQFIESAGEPRHYWVGVRLPVRERDLTRLPGPRDPSRPALDRDQPRPMPLNLLATSDSIAFGGMFFDPFPWVIVGFGAMFCSVLFWFPLVHGITRSISQMTHATEEVAEGRFDAQVQSGRWDELGRLAQAINRMAHRLTGFVHGQKRFLGDIAHELCSPIARIQLALGILEQRADERQKSYVEDVREEVQHMSQLVNELLSFSKAELRRKEIQLHPVNLAAIAARVVDREAGGNSNVTVRIDPALEVVAQPDLLARALANVVRNALRYAGQAGSIVVSGRSDGHYATLSVSDQGPGLPAQELEKIFDPFYRLEPSRSRETGGSGLGLSIVKSCVEACQGKVTARNRQPSGLEIEMTFRTPAASADN